MQTKTGAVNISSSVPKTNYWLVITPNFRIAIEKLPSWWFRLWQYLFLGWKYEDVWQ